MHNWPTKAITIEAGKFITHGNIPKYKKFITFIITIFHLITNLLFEYIYGCVFSIEYLKTPNINNISEGYKI